MPLGTIEIEGTQKVDVEDFADTLASGLSEDQGRFFEEFFVQLDVACGVTPNGTNRQLEAIVKEMGLHARGILEKMGELSKEAK
jgi:hypothetical protein